MLKKSLLVLLGMFLITYTLACGGKSNTEELCDALAAKVFASCDVTDEADVATIQQTYLALTGETLTDAEVAASSASSLSQECTTGFNEADYEITDEIKTTVIEALDGIPNDCATMAQYIALIFG